MGAAEPCPSHPDILLDRQLDDDLLAECQRQAWDGLVRRARAAGFDGDPDVELQSTYIYVLQSVYEVCPKCGAVIDPPDDPSKRRKPHPFLE